VQVDDGVQPAAQLADARERLVEGRIGVAAHVASSSLTGDGTSATCTASSGPVDAGVRR
jgi:hypothetical protein